MPKSCFHLAPTGKKKVKMRSAQLGDYNGKCVRDDTSQKPHEELNKRESVTEKLKDYEKEKSVLKPMKSNDG